LKLKYVLLNNWRWVIRNY